MSKRVFAKVSAKGWSGRRQNLSTVILGLDPRIHNPLKSMDPRVKPEDNVECVGRFVKMGIHGNRPAGCRRKSRQQGRGNRHG